MNTKQRVVLHALILDFTPSIEFYSLQKVKYQKKKFFFCGFSGCLWIWHRSTGVSNVAELAAPDVLQCRFYSDKPTKFTL